MGEMMTWRPISTAPTDGREILACESGFLDCGDPFHWMDVVQFLQPNRGADGWYSVGGERGPPSCEPTHWMPLPAPPAALPPSEDPTHE